MRCRSLRWAIGAMLLREPDKRCARVRRDETLAPQIQWVWQANMKVYGADKALKQLAHEGTVVARCTVERLMLMATAARLPACFDRRKASFCVRQRDEDLNATDRATAFA